MSGERRSTSPVVDKKGSSQELAQELEWSEGALTAMREAFANGEEIAAGLQKLELVNTDDETLQQFAERFSEIKAIFAQSLWSLAEAIQTTQEVGEDLAEFLGDTSELEQRSNRWKPVLAEVERNIELLHATLTKRESQREAEKREERRRGEFVNGLALSGLAPEKVLEAIEQFIPEKVADFLAEKAEKIKASNSFEGKRRVEAVEQSYAAAIRDIQEQRASITERLVKSEGLQKKEKALQNEDVKKILRDKGTLAQAEAAVAAQLAQELGVFREAEEARLEGLSDEAQLKKEKDMRTAVGGSVRLYEVAGLVDNAEVPLDALAEKLADERVSTFKKLDSWGPYISKLSHRETFHLPKEVLDQIVRKLSYQQIAEIVANAGKDEPLFWTESFVERLEGLKQRYNEIKQGRMFRGDPWNESRFSPEQDAPELFAEYVRRDDELAALYVRQRSGNEKHYEIEHERRLAQLRVNELFVPEMQNMFEQAMISRVLRGVQDNSHVEISAFNQRKLSKWDGERILFGDNYYVNPSRDDIENRDVVMPLSFNWQNPPKGISEGLGKETLQRMSFYEIEKNFLHWYQAVDQNYTITKEEKNSRAQQIRQEMKELAESIEKAFGSLEQDVAPLRTEAERLEGIAVQLRKELQGEVDGEKLEKLLETNKKLQRDFQEYQRQVQNLRKRSNNWATLTAEIGEDQRAWEQRVDEALGSHVGFETIQKEVDGAKRHHDAALREVEAAAERLRFEQKNVLDQINTVVSDETRRIQQIEAKLRGAKSAFEANQREADTQGSVFRLLQQAETHNKGLSFPLGFIGVGKQEIQYVKNGEIKTFTGGSKDRDDTNKQIETQKQEAETKFKEANERITRFRTEFSEQISLLEGITSATTGLRNIPKISAEQIRTEFALIEAEKKRVEGLFPNKSI